MEKFLNIPVTGQGKQLVPCSGLKLVEAASATSTTLSYGSGKVVTITHASVGAASGTNSGTQFRNFIQTAVQDALSTGWTNVSVEELPKYAVSDISIA
jgi:hypothetical protein|tara:strand:+ start:1345 stop:1638 length:294 start_codon:yes stop_codon:yes gene_type:complete